MADLIDVVIIHATLVRATPEQVYDALTTSSGLDSWFTSGATVDPHPGGEIRFRWKAWGPDAITAEDGGPILAAERPHRFVFQWSPDNATYRTTVEFDLKPRDFGNTVVTVREHGYHDTPHGRKALLSCATGWGEALTLLKFYVEHGIHY